MPYSGQSDKSLPSNVKKLGAKERRQWVNTFNSAYARRKKEGASDKQAETFAFKSANGMLKKASFASLLGGEHPLGRSFIELSAAEPPETINVFPPPGTYKHPLWGDFEVTEEGNQQFVDNFNAHVYQEHVPIDAEHETKVSGAVGYLKELSLNDDGSIEATVDWTERGQKLIENDSFKYISPQWYEEWTDPASDEEFENVLIGAALTTRPFFKDLRSLVASEGRLFDVEGPDGERVPVIRSSIEGVSYNDLQSMIMSAARHEFHGTFGGDYNSWVVDLFDDYVIICGSDGSTYWRLDYEVGGDDEITFSGQPSEVQRKTVWEDAQHQAKEDALEHTNDPSRRPRTKKSKEAHMTEPDVKELTEKVGELEEEEQKSLFQRLAATLKATVTFGHDGEGDGDPKPGDETKPGEGSTEGDGNPKTAAEITALQTQLAASEEARTASDTRLSGLEATERTRRFRDIILGRDEAGIKQAKEASPAVTLHPMVGALAAKLQIMDALAATKGEDSDEFKAYVAGEREHASQLHAAGTFEEAGVDSHGSVDSSAVTEFDRRVAELTGGEKPLSEAEATMKVATDDPKLYDRYDREKTGRKVSFSGS